MAAWRKSFQEVFWRLYLAPSLSTEDSKYMPVGNPEVTSNGTVFFSGRNPLEYGSNIFFEKYWAIVLLISVGSALFDHIAHVFSVSAKKKMFWVAAQRVVAPMQDIQSWQNWPLPMQPCNSVSGNCLAVPFAMSVLVVLATRPRPARIFAARSVYTGKKVIGLFKVFSTPGTFKRYLIGSHGKLLSCLVRGAAPLLTVDAPNFYHVALGGAK